MSGPNHGFTLIEVLIAMTILAIGVFSMFSALGTSSIMADNAMDRDRVLQVMESEMEDLLTQPPGQLTNAGLDVPGLIPQAPRAKVIQRTVQHLGDGDITKIGIYKVTLEAKWMRNEGPQSYTIDFYQVNRGG